MPGRDDLEEVPGRDDLEEVPGREGPGEIGVELPARKEEDSIDEASIVDLAAR